MSVSAELTAHPSGLQALSALADLAPAALGLLDADLRYVYANAELAAILGRARPEELLGHRVDEATERVPVALTGLLEVVVASGEAQTAVAIRVPFAGAASGVRTFTLDAYPVDREGRRLVACSLVETTEHDETRQALRRRSAEGEALRRVATLVAGATGAEAVFAAVAEEAARLLDGHAGAVIRFDEGGREARVMAAWSDASLPTLPSGTTFSLDEPSPAGDVWRHGRTCRRNIHADGAEGSVLRELHASGVRSSVAARIHAGSRAWGALVILSALDGGRAFVPGAEDQLARFAELVGLAVVNADVRARLVREAGSCPLTGVANHRVFHERLRAAYAHARRHRRPLALIVFDVDLFKQVNDSRGHQAGDDVLIALADRVDSGVREGELLARLGGDEFAILLPDADATAAMAAAERLRAAVAARPLAGSDVTVSIGVCTIEDAGSPDELLRLADGALYWGKAQGRNRSTLYQRETVAYLSATERADRLERSRTLAGVRALARAVDAKDRSTHAHSERVAHVAGLLATAIGWPAERVALLREVALMHDVGKIGVPDHILLKPDRLTEEEYEQVKQHAALGAQIACEVLSAEQVAWVRGHHERYDARGYPDGLAGPEIADGAALLALADAWDAMVSDRPYSRGRTVEEALEECRRGSGAQFAPHAVAALERVYAAGHLLSP